MSKRVLFIGGSGEISASCVEQAVLEGHVVSTFNRGQRRVAPSEGVEHISGDLRDEKTLASIAKQQYDVICQFLAFTPDDIERDVSLFNDNCDQYIFISSASAYQKPNQVDLIHEEVPLDNPFWAYSRDKAASEAALQASPLPFTIVRPSHTYRERVPSTVIDGKHLLWRLRHNKPIIVHEDGETLWTLTRSEDFARAFTYLFDNPDAIGETYHITDSQAHSWNLILSSIAEILEQGIELHPVSTKNLVQYEPSWEGPLYGDKANNAVFDNTKIAAISDGWQCEISLLEGLQRAISCAIEDDKFTPDKNTDALVDRIIKENA